MDDQELFPETPVAWVIRAPNGFVRMWTQDEARAKRCATEWGLEAREEALTPKAHISISAAAMAPDDVRMVPDGAPASLRDAAPGPFRLGSSIGFKTEYGRIVGLNVGGGKVEWSMTNQPDVYVLESGEAFWGGTDNSVDRDDLIVQPLAVAAAPAVQPAAGREEIARLLDELIAHIVAIGPDDPKRVGTDREYETPMARRVWREVFADLILAALAHPPAQASESGGEVERLRAALEPFAKLARVRYPEEGGAPSWIDLMTNNGECDELELRSHVALDRDRAQLLDAADFRNAEAALSAPQAEGERAKHD